MHSYKRAFVLETTFRDTHAPRVSDVCLTTDCSIVYIQLLILAKDLSLYRHAKLQQVVLHNIVLLALELINIPVHGEISTAQPLPLLMR